MIVQRLRVNPFGFFADREVQFASGLNVIVGPNEAGKSTLFSALRSSLLRTKLQKIEFSRHIERFLPAAGGDAVRVELQFAVDESVYVLRRRWGPQPASEMVLPTGGSLSDDDAISQKLDAILPAPRAAFWRILMTGQAELVATLESLKKSADILADLADTVRAAVLETGGVSVDRFRALLAQRITESDAHWDTARGLPEAKQRGSSGRWGREIGHVLRAYYDREDARISHEAALRYESELDGINQRLRDLSRRISETESFLSHNKKAFADAQQGTVLEAKLEAARAKADELRRASREWPVAEAKSAELEAALAAVARRLPQLEAERLESARAEKAKRLAERLTRVQRKKALLEEATATLAKAPLIERAQLDAIRKAEQTAAVLRESTEAGMLSVNILAKGDISFAVQADTGPESREHLAKGQSRGVRGAARVRVRYQDMELEIASGGALLAEHGTSEADAQAVLTSLLSSAGARSSAEAAELLQRRERRLADVEAARRALDEELAGDRLDDLQEQAASLSVKSDARPLVEVEKEISRLEAERDAKARSRDELTKRIAEWTAAYQSLDGLVDSLAASQRTQADLRAAMEQSAPLPSGFANAAAFVKEYEKKREQAAKLAQDKTAVLLGKADLEKESPDASAEELAEVLQDAESRFQAALSRSQALRKVAALTDALMSDSDAVIVSGMKTRLEKLISAMSLDRYRTVHMDGALPGALESQAGTLLGWDRLSAGTKDLLALALRLTMAQHFLGAAKGFAVMDDPLVDMDPVRQEAAARALKAFATEKQLLIFTCHPRHAELLGGNRIEL